MHCIVAGDYKKYFGYLEVLEQGVLSCYLAVINVIPCFSLIWVASDFHGSTIVFI